MNDDENLEWVSAKSYKDRWRTNKNLPGGGQGEAFKAERILDQKTAFLKTIKSKRDAERRARFFREATAYESFGIEGIPRLIESNSHLHKDLSKDLYIAAEFIEGPTLRQWRSNQTAVDIETASSITLKLLAILRACHEAGCIHRDIKPDNIILADGNPFRPYLLDFGLAYHELREIDFQTEDGQEVGNRFLRLPELSAGSSQKQDPRSDVSFAGGILFYLLTGDHPDVLQDGNGRLPHQRSLQLAKLQTAAGAKFAALATIFENTFSPLLSSRFSNADAMSSLIERMLKADETANSPEDDLSALLAIVDSDAERRRVETNQRISDALYKVQEVFSEVNKELGNKFRINQTNFNVQISSGNNTLFWTRISTDEKVLTTTYEVNESGDELIFIISGETVSRISLGGIDYGDRFRTAVRAWILRRLREVMTDPDALPPEADNFREQRPHSKLLDAQAAAASTGRHILAFVYDPSQPERGRLQHKLGYFLQNRRTRDSMNAAFVTALVPLSQVQAVSNYLSDKSMEDARWVLFDKELNALDTHTISANPDTGENTISRLVAHHTAKSA